MNNGINVNYSNQIMKNRVAFKGDKGQIVKNIVKGVTENPLVAGTTTALTASSVLAMQNGKTTTNSIEKIEYYKNGEVKHYTGKDGSEVIYFDNGIPAYVKNEDGSILEYYPNGILKLQENADGTAVAYYKNGVSKLYEKFESGLITRYGLSGFIHPRLQQKPQTDKLVQEKDFSISYDNGKEKMHFYPTGKIEGYYENGNFKFIEQPDGTKTIFYENGQIKSEIGKKEYKYYYENGQIKQEGEVVQSYDESGYPKGPSYNHKAYYENGQLEWGGTLHTTFIDKKQEYYSNGQPKFTKDEYGTYYYDEQGHII